MKEYKIKPILDGGKIMATNEVILAFIGEPASPESPCTATSHGYDAFVHAESAAIINLFRSLSLWMGSTKTYKKDEKYYSYYELDCRDKDFFKSDIFKRICKPYDLKVTIIEDAKELYNEFYSKAKLV